MTIYPAIDIRGGQCVRLTQGRADAQTVYSEDPAAVAAGFREAGASWVHVVDLDGAFSGKPGNAEAIRRIAATGLSVQLGGGLRDSAMVEQALLAGVARVVLGTRAAESESFVAELVGRFGDRIAVGIDAKDGKVAVRGWVETTGSLALDLARRMDAIGVSTIIHTDVGTDGMLTGPNFKAQEALLAAVRARVIASGGVGKEEEISQFVRLKEAHPNLDGVIVGKALYEGRVSLPRLLAISAGVRG
jgi:phosphoribosylformimino-5-aminoimidazole carboxamide ribotide isomerase